MLTAAALQYTLQSQGVAAGQRDIRSHESARGLYHLEETQRDSFKRESENSERESLDALYLHALQCSGRCVAATAADRFLLCLLDVLQSCQHEPAALQGQQVEPAVEVKHFGRLLRVLLQVLLNSKEPYKTLMKKIMTAIVRICDRIPQRLK